MSAVVWTPGTVVPAPLNIYTCKVEQDWVDYNGHMTESRYLQVFGDAIDVLFRSAGIDERYRAAGRMFYTVETHITHQAEALVNESLYLTSQVLSVDDKRLQVFHRLHRATDATLLATCEQMYLHVDTQRKKSCSIEPAVRARLTQLAAAHAKLPDPAQRGRAVGRRLEA